MRTLTTTIFAALALSPVTVQAEEAGNADSIVVTATRSETKLFETGKSISVIDAATIERRQTLSVADLLRTTAGVTIARNGGPGGFSSVFIRGASSEQTVALIDGVKINDPASPGGGFNFADLLTDNLDRIEILRGPQSVLWGSRAIGGVINIITRAPTEALEARASGEYGGYDQGHASASVTGRAGPVGFSAGAGYLTTDGFSTAANGTEKDGYHIFGANLNTKTRISDAVSLDLRGYYTRSRVDLDGFVFLPPSSFVFGDTNQYQRQEQIVGYAGLNAALFDGRLKNRLAASYTYTRAETAQDITVPGFFMVPGVFEHTATLVMTTRWTGRVDSTLDLFYGGQSYGSFSAAGRPRAYLYPGFTRAAVIGRVRLSQDVDPAVRAYAKVDNLFDDTYYQGGWRALGRTVAAGVSIGF